MGRGGGGAEMAGGLRDGAEGAHKLELNGTAEARRTGGVGV